MHTSDVLLIFFSERVYKNYLNAIYIYAFSRRFYPKRLTIGEYIKRLILKRQTDRVMPITPSLRHCSNKYKLGRERGKEKDEDLEKVNN